jgi:hypothetical protein
VPVRAGTICRFLVFYLCHFLYILVVQLLLTGAFRPDFVPGIRPYLQMNWIF